MPFVIKETFTVKASFLGGWEGLGEVYNGLSVGIYLVKVNATLRDANNRILDVDCTYVQGSPTPGGYLAYIGPGGRSSFDLISSVPLDDVASYELTVTYTVADRNSLLVGGRVY